MAMECIPDVEWDDLHAILPPILPYNLGQESFELLTPGAVALKFGLIDSRHDVVAMIEDLA